MNWVVIACACRVGVLLLPTVLYFCITRVIGKDGWEVREAVTKAPSLPAPLITVYACAPFRLVSTQRKPFISHADFTAIGFAS